MRVSKLNHPQAIIQPELDDIWMAIFMLENAICNGWHAANWAHFSMVPLASHPGQERLLGHPRGLGISDLGDADAHHDGTQGQGVPGLPWSFWPRKFIEEVWKNDGKRLMVKKQFGLLAIF